jgi:hypothetical protein
MAFFIFFISCFLAFNLTTARADSLSDQSPETDAMHEIKSDETMAADEMGGNIQGVVVNVNPVSEILTVRDDDEDDQLYSISVKKSTSYSGIASLADINPGDSISVDCYDLNGHLVAETVTLEDRVNPPEKDTALPKVLED